MADEQRTSGGGATKHELLERVAAVFRRHGLEVSTDLICAELGISKGGLYHHFASKRELMLAALRETGVSRRMPTKGLVRLLPTAARDPEVQRLVGRAQGPMVFTPEALIEEALNLGEDLSRLRAGVGGPVPRPTAAVRKFDSR